MTSSEAWWRHVTRTVPHLGGAGVVRGVTGELQRERMTHRTDLLVHKE